MKPRILLSYVHMGGTERDWVEKALLNRNGLFLLVQMLMNSNIDLRNISARQTLWLSAQAQLPSILHWLPSALALEMR